MYVFMYVFDIRLYETINDDLKLFNLCLRRKIRA